MPIPVNGNIFKIPVGNDPDFSPAKTVIRSSPVPSPVDGTDPVDILFCKTMLPALNELINNLELVLAIPVKPVSKIFPLTPELKSPVPVTFWDANENPRPPDIIPEYGKLVP